MKIIFVLLLIVSVQNIFGQEKPNYPCSDCKSLPKLIFVPQPEFPEVAKLSGISGKVKVQVSIDEQGNVTEAKLIEGNKIFEENAVKAAMLAKFKPSKYFVDGQAVDSFGVIVFDFILDSLSAQNPPKVIEGGICNGMALSIPKPEVPPSVINANGKGIFGIVNVQVLVDEKGDVEKAQAVTGHLLMRPIAEKSAIAAKFRVNSHFPPAKISCVLVYNFSAFDPKKSTEETDSTIMLGVLNEKALILQMPKYPSADAKISGTVNVKTIINLQSGEVVSAEAISGHPLLRIEAEKAAFQTKLPPALTEFSNVFGQGFLIYKIEDFNGKTIENKTPKKFLIIEKGVVNDRAKSLPKPFYSPDIKATGIVKVKVLIDVLNGKVVLAKAISGHSILWAFAEAAARKAEFLPAFINTSEPIYVKASLLYKFNSDHTVETNLTDKDLRSVKQKESYPVISCGQCGSEPVFLAKPEYPSGEICERERSGQSRNSY